MRAVSPRIRLGTAAAAGERQRCGNFRSLPQAFATPADCRAWPTGCPITQHTAAQNDTDVHACRMDFQDRRW